MGTVKKAITLSVENEVIVTLIQIPESSARNILNRHLDKVKKSKDWINALIFFIPFTLTYFLSDFSSKSLFGWEVSSDQIATFFFLCWIFALGYMLYTIYNAIKHKDSVDDIITDLMDNTRF